MNTFAYLFERFPSFNQTFCSREVEEMIRQGMNPLVVSIRSEKEGTGHDYPAEFARAVHHLPSPEEMESEAKKLREERRLPGPMGRALGRWGARGDKMRVYEAANLGPLLKARGVRHVHAHFAGIAARTAYWLNRFYGIGYSFTGHANDIFRETDFPVSLANLVEDARFVATASDFSRDWLAQKFPRQAKKIFGVYNGIHVGKFASTASRAGGGILTVGRYVEKKGFAHLIEACRILKERGVPFHCDIVGEGPLQESLAAQIDAAGLAGRVVLAGPRSQAELLPLYAASGLFVLPCVREAGGGMDNLPTVIMEAMAAGLPVISTPIAGVPEMIVEGRTGWVVPEKDPAALAGAIARALSTPDLAATCGEQGRLRAAELFSIETTARRLKHLLVRLGDVRPGSDALKQDALLKKRLFRRPAILLHASGLAGL